MGKTKPPSYFYHKNLRIIRAARHARSSSAIDSIPSKQRVEKAIKLLKQAQALGIPIERTPEEIYQMTRDGVTGFCNQIRGLINQKLRGQK